MYVYQHYIATIHYLTVQCIFLRELVWNYKNISYVLKTVTHNLSTTVFLGPAEVKLRHITL